MKSRFSVVMIKSINRESSQITRKRVLIHFFYNSPGHKLTQQKWRTTMNTTDNQLLKELNSVTTQQSEILELSQNDAYSTNSNSNSEGWTTIADLVTQMEKMDKISLYTTGKRCVASWRKAEVARLEDLVFQFGTDFTRVAQIMGKDRDQVKRKFKTMQKKNSNFGFTCGSN